MGEFDVLVGINLLREGLDIPEVSLVAILDADKEGFLRNNTSLIQTFGRAARHIDGMVILYADHATDSIRNAMAETERRRRKQIQYNKKNQITPQSVVKPIPNKISAKTEDIDLTKSMARTDLVKLAAETETAMKRFAEDLDFEKAIEFRERLIKIKRAIGEPTISEVS